MVFEYSRWDRFCRALQETGSISIPACEVNPAPGKYIVLKHDVETDVPRAYEMAKIEHKYGHRGSYYVQAYLMKEERNIDLLRRMQQMGHEISYHHDVMDSNQKDLQLALKDFEANRQLFETHGFPVKTVCQHSNPVLETGKTSNRDFFRSAIVQELYPQIADILVDYKEKYHTEYTYYSDAGRGFNMIYDPINNDRIKSDDKNIRYADLEEVLAAIRSSGNAMLSTHTHRWCRSAAEYTIKNGVYKAVKGTAKALLHLPGIKKLMGRYYYLAKKI